MNENTNNFNDIKIEKTWIHDMLIQLSKLYWEIGVFPMSPKNNIQILLKQYKKVVGNESLS